MCLIPKPPKSLEADTCLQATEAIFFHSKLPPQRNCLWMEVSLLISAVGALKKDNLNTGNAVRTTLIRVILPAIEHRQCCRGPSTTSWLYPLGAWGKCKCYYYLGLWIILVQVGTLKKWSLPNKNPVTDIVFQDTKKAPSGNLHYMTKNMHVEEAWWAKPKQHYNNGI